MIKKTQSKTTKDNKKKTSIKKSINTKKLNKTFHYDRRKLIGLAVFNVLFTMFIWKMTSCLLSKGLITSSIEMCLHIIVISLAILALIGSTFVAIHPLRLALLTDEGITIDHNETLKWQDIEIAKEVKAPYFLPQQAIALHVKEGVTHKLTFMQKICENNVFTAFSIPVYAMTVKDANEIRKIIKQKCKYENTLK